MQLFCRLLLLVMCSACATPRDAERDHRKALILHRAQQLDGALEQYRRALGHENKAAGVYNNLAAALYQQGLIKNAQEALGKALKASSPVVESQLNAILFLLMDGRLQEARDAAQALQEKFPNTALVNLIAALPLVAQKKETKKALLLLEKALSAKESSTLAQVHFARGVLFARTERFAKAAEAFEAVTRLRMDAIAHANAAIAHAAMGQTERALQQLARAGDLDPKAPQIACLQALVLWKQGKRERAHKELARAKALKPPLADVFELEAQLAIDEKNWEVAAAALKEAIALDNGNANAHFNLGLTLLEIGKLRAARNEFAIAAKLNPKDADAKHNYDALTRVLARP